jgi:hypothetical protein
MKQSELEFDLKSIDIELRSLRRQVREQRQEIDELYEQMHKMQKHLGLVVKQLPRKSTQPTAPGPLRKKIPYHPEQDNWTKGG